MSIFSLCCFESATDLLKTETDGQRDRKRASLRLQLLWFYFTKKLDLKKLVKGKTVSFLDAKCNQKKVIKYGPYECNSNRMNLQTLSPLSGTQ